MKSSDKIQVDINLDSTYNICNKILKYLMFTKVFYSWREVYFAFWSLFWFAI